MMDWLPSQLPIKVVVSTSDDRILDAIRRRATAPTELTLAPLGFDERRKIIRTLLWQYRKRLEEQAFNNQLKVGMVNWFLDLVDVWKKVVGGVDWFLDLVVFFWGGGLIWCCDGGMAWSGVFVFAAVL